MRFFGLLIDKKIEETDVLLSFILRKKFKVSFEPTVIL
jgi:hypothetical protein